MKNNAKTAGVSLIEVMISMVLIALLLVAIVSIFPRMNAHNKGMSEADQAKLIASEVLEGLQELSEAPNFDCATTGFGNHLAGYNDFWSRVVVGWEIGAVTYNVKPLTAPVCVSGTINTVTVQIEWTKQGPHKIEVTGAVR